MVDKKFDTTVYLANEKASEQFAMILATCLPNHAKISLSGEIGSGKTSIIRAILKELGVKTAIKSPSFSLVESYHCPKLWIHHFDLYRIHQEEELEYIGFRDYFTDSNLAFIEWPEHAGSRLPSIDLRLNLSIEGAGRRLHIHALTAIGEQIISCMMSKW